MFCSAETPPAQTLRLRPMRRTPAHPRRSSNQVQSLMFETSHCRPHNSFDGLSGCFKACTSALFARHPHDQAQSLMLKTGQRAHRKFPTRPRTPAHPRRSSSKTQPLMFETSQCRPHNSLDGLSGYFKACTSALFARHPHDQTQSLMPETSQDCPRKLFERIPNELQSAHRSPLPLVRPWPAIAAQR